MDQEIENKLDIKSSSTKLFNQNKYKIFALIIVLVLIAISLIFLKNHNDKKNVLIAEKYVQAGVYLEMGNKNQAKNIYEEIIIEKNNFYSLLSLNKIVEKDLISDKSKILKYFDKLETSATTRDNKDLITLKKALYMIKFLDAKAGNDLLKSLIDEDSEFKIIAKDLIEE